MKSLRRSAAPGLAALTCLLACGARSSLPGYGNGGAATTTTTTTSTPCADGAVEACGSDVGACKPGTRTCQAGVFGPCEGEIGPTPEVCNGIDDNCNGVIDADCQMGDCKPGLLVTGSVPSSPNCIDFPVMAGSTGTIEYPCGGGPVTADLGGVMFTGSVTNNYVTLDGFVIIPPTQSPDGCTWKMHHHIEGTIPTGMVSYSYSEAVIVKPPGTNCWSPCTETGTVKIDWVAGP